MSTVNSIMNKCTARGELLNEVELIAVGGKDRQTSFGGCQEDERIVETLFALMSLKTLGAGERACDQAGFYPNVVLRR